MHEAHGSVKSIRSRPDGSAGLARLPPGALRDHILADHDRDRGRLRHRARRASSGPMVARVVRRFHVAAETRMLMRLSGSRPRTVTDPRKVTATRGGGHHHLGTRSLTPAHAQSDPAAASFPPNPRTSMLYRGGSLRSTLPGDSEMPALGNGLRREGAEGPQTHSAEEENVMMKMRTLDRKSVV